MSGMTEDARSVFWWIGPVARAIGLWKPVVAIVISVGAGLWAMVDHLPWSVMAVVSLMALVTTIYLLLLPAVIRQLTANEGTSGARKRPDLSMYRHHESFSLRQAASLLAESDPMCPYLDTDAKNWSAAIYAALKDGKIERIRTRRDDGDHTFSDVYEPHSGTMISRQQFLTFCQLHNKKPKFLSD